MGRFPEDFRGKTSKFVYPLSYIDETCHIPVFFNAESDSAIKYLISSLTTAGWAQIWCQFRQEITDSYINIEIKA